MKSLKYLIPLFLCMAFLWACTTQVEKAPSAPLTGADAVQQGAPIVLKGGANPLISVTFPHVMHEESGIPCETCHHESSADIPYSSCRELCHSEPGSRTRDPMSMFMAFHAKGIDRSCYGCHSQLAEQEPERYSGFTNCRPCHAAPPEK